MDLRIASIVIANQMTLLTRNTVDFQRVPGLHFEDWTVPLRDSPSHLQ
jgi:tRNA(fMet)-specific endonuclease VapC